MCLCEIHSHNYLYINTKLHIIQFQTIQSGQTSHDGMKETLPEIAWDYVCGIPRQVKLLPLYSSQGGADHAT